MRSFQNQFIDLHRDSLKQEQQQSMEQEYLRRFIGHMTGRVPEEFKKSNWKYQNSSGQA